MSDFLIETHAHTSEVSGCAKIPAAKVITAYEEAGYDGIIITDHMSRHSVGKLKNKSWDEKIDFFIKGYNEALNAAKKSEQGLTVLFGMELRFNCDDSNDYLVYGIDEDFLRRNKNLLDLNLKKFRKVADENGLLIFQAHPFRIGMEISDYRLLDGVEVYNGNANHNSSNDVAMFWADKYNLLKSSGSDFHEMWEMEQGGIYFKSPIKTNAQLVTALKENNYSLK